MGNHMSVVTVVLTIALALLPKPGHAMNDTDGVIAKGLFPLEAGSKALEITSEKVAITLAKEGLRKHVSYEIRNNGESASFVIGTDCTLNYDATASDIDCGRVRVDGVLMPMETEAAYLKDAGPVVEVRERSRGEIAECMKYVDGTICGHVWGHFETNFSAGAVRRLELDYLDPVDSSRFVEQMTGQLYLYTEKFWAGAAVPQIEVRFAIEGYGLPLSAFVPRGEYAEYAMHPTAVDDGGIVWRFNAYKPDKRPYTYTLKITHPAAIDARAICKAAEIATSMKICEPNSRAAAPGDAKRDVRVSCAAVGRVWWQHAPALASLEMRTPEAS